MKRCPTCNRIESNDELVFCRTDGSRLFVDGEIAEPATAILRFQVRNSGFTSADLASGPSVAVLPFVNMSADADNDG